jgi:hypothetical protein
MRSHRKDLLSGHRGRVFLWRARDQSAVELKESHELQWTMRTWALLWSTRIKQFPHIYSTVGSASSSTGGALAAAAVTSGGGTILSVF